MPGVARALQVNKDTLRLYWNNSNRNGGSLTQSAVTNMERHIIDYLAAHQASQEVPTVIAAQLPKSVSGPIRVHPLHSVQTPDAGDLAVMALGEVFKARRRVFKVQRSDTEIPLRRGFQAAIRPSANR